MKKQIFISIPHGGQRIPDELKDRTTLTAADIFADSDPFTDIIYNLEPEGFTVIKADIARAFVDLNRAPDDLPPANPDGIIKSHTCYHIPVYSKDHLPGGALIKTLLAMYYHPYHRQVEELSRDKNILLGLDCHSMASYPPPVSPDKNGKRPPICLGNVRGRSCDESVVKRLAESLSLGFSVPESDIAVNRPFSGGFITRQHGNHPKPWIQIELNREFYLSDPWFKADQLHVAEDRLIELNKMFSQSIGHFLSEDTIELLETVNRKNQRGDA